MKKLLCGIALGTVLALGSNWSVAQSTEATPPPPPSGGYHHGPMNPAARAAHLAKRLNLSSEQQGQVQTILASAQTEHQALEQDQTITHQQFLIQSKALHEQTESKIEALLNDTQKAQFAEMREHLGRGPRPGGEGAPPQPEQ